MGIIDSFHQKRRVEMLLMTVNDPMFKWFLLLGAVTFTLCIVLEIRYRRKQKQQALLPEQQQHDRHEP
jgi:hypothetical protein